MGETDTNAPPLAPVSKDQTILLVEDDASVLRLASRTLERFGYRVSTAGSPDEALTWAEHHAGEIGLLITDVTLPKMSGWDLAKNLLALNPDMRLLFMSGYAARAIADQDLLLAGALFLQKPFTLKTLSAKVAEALSASLPMPRNCVSPTPACSS